MLQKQKNWNFTYSELEIDDTKGELNIPPVVKRLLNQRGLTSDKDMQLFLSPQLSNLHDPFNLNGIEAVKERIQQAVQTEEKILVFGDYDADGVSATAILIEALRELGACCNYYIPNRFTEGYGPSEQAFREASKQGYDLIITVDTGIAALEPAQVAKELGVDLIITDHHEVQEELPEAFAILHPKCSPDYPFKELAGAAVAFKLAEYLLGYFPKQLLDLVVIGTIADLVPLVEENRILASHGLTAITESNRPGIKALKEISGIKGKVTEEDIGFLIGPRINAVGRLQDASPAVELLLTEDQVQASTLAKEIDGLNQKRQKIVAAIAKEAEEIVIENPSDHKNVIVVAKEGWNEGVLGIVASKLVRKFQRPTVCLTIKPEDGSAKGSARSIPKFNLFANGMRLKEKGLFLKFGGHAQAAGMSLSIDRIDEVRIQLNALAEQQLTPEDYKEQLNIEAKIRLKQIDLSLIQNINQLAPFGMDNPKPLFYVKAKLNELRQIGAKKNHLKLTFVQDEAELAAVGFGMGEYYHSISNDVEVESVGYIQLNEWNGKKTPQLMLEDMGITEWQLFDYRGSKMWQTKTKHLSNRDTVWLRFKSESLISDATLNLVTYDRSTWEQEKLTLDSCTNLVLVDLPYDLEDLKAVLSDLRPNHIYTCYRLEQEQYLDALPSRTDFKWFYAMLIKRGAFNQQTELTLLSKQKGWKQNKIRCIIEVFSELEFVSITDHIVRPIQGVKKRELTESSLYKKAIKQSEVEQMMYYSNYQQLKEWLNSQMERKSSIEEDKVYGL